MSPSKPITPTASVGPDLLRQQKTDEPLNSPPSSATGSRQRHRPPMLVLDSSQGSSPNSRGSFSNINLSTLNRNTATTTTTLSATPSSAIFPALRTPKDIVLQDIAVQCISPGLPTFPSSMRDAVAKSKSIQEAQRKIIAQRMKNGDDTLDTDSSEQANEGNSQSDGRDAGQYSPSPSNKTTNREESSSPSSTKNLNATKDDENSHETSFSMSRNASLKPQNNETTQTDTNGSLNGTANKEGSSGKDDGDNDDIIEVSIRPSSDVSSKEKTNNTPNKSMTPKQLDSNKNSSSENSNLSKKSNHSSQPSNSQIIVSGDLVIEAIPTPTLPSHPSFNSKKWGSSLKSSKRAPPPSSISVNNFAKGPSIHSAPLHRAPAPFSPYNISQFPGYQPYIIPNATANKSDSTKPLFMANGTTSVNGATNGSTGVTTAANGVTANGYSTSLSQAPVYPAAPGGRLYYARPQYTAYPTTPLVASTGTLPGAGASTLATAPFYRNPHMVPVYVGGQATLSPMTASAASWTGRTYVTNINSKNGNKSNEEDDDGSDPEDAALSDNESNDNKSSKVTEPVKRSISGGIAEAEEEDDDMDDVEQRAIGEDDEINSRANKKRRLETGPEANGNNVSNKQRHNISTPPNRSLSQARPELASLITATVLGNIFGNNDNSSASPIANYKTASSGGVTFEDFQHFRNKAAQILNVNKDNNGSNNNNNSDQSSPSRQDALKNNQLKKQRFLELCSELWDLTKSI